MTRLVLVGLAVVVLVAIVVGGVAAYSGGGGGGKQKASPALHGTAQIGVIAPSGAGGALGRRGQDLIDGANMAANEVNAGGGVLGKRVELTAVDDSCAPLIGYEAAKSFAETAGVTGVVGGVCDAATAREASVIDSAGIPYLVTSANGATVVTPDLVSTYLMNGTIYQQALSVVYWMNYRSAQRLAIVGDRSAGSKALTKNVITLIDQAPRLVSLQTLPVGQTDMGIVAKAAVASHPDFVLWTGGPAGGGALAKALHDAGYTKPFTATAASESPRFLAAAGPNGADGTFITATSTGENTPMSGGWPKRFEAEFHHAPGLDALQAYDAVRELAQAARQAKSTTNGRAIGAQLPKLSTDFTTFLGVVRYARDHTLLYDNRVILVVKDGKFTWKRSLRTDSLQ